MSSLRRRAICVQRAMSTERSSIGGRASARTTAAGVGGVGQQPQPGEHVADLGALEERRLADDAVGTARSSSATATACPSREIAGTSTAISPGRHALARRSAARCRRPPTAPGRARWRSARTRPPRPPPAARTGTSTAADAARSTRAGQRRLCSSVRSPRRSCASRRSRRPEAPQRRIGGRRSAVDPATDRASSRRRRGRAPARRRPAGARTARRAPAARGPRRSASRIRSPASRAPASASIRSWAR